MKNTVSEIKSPQDQMTGRMEMTKQLGNLRTNQLKLSNLKDLEKKTGG